MVLDRSFPLSAPGVGPIRDLYIPSLTRTTPFLLAANNSPDEYKQIARVVCDGTADNVDIQEAIDRADTTNLGAEVVLAPGTYNLAATVTLNYNGLVIRGIGGALFSGPKLVWTGAQDGTMLHQTNANPFRGLILANLYIDGADSAGICINLDGPTPGSSHDKHLSNIEVTGYRLAGIVLGKWHTDLANNGSATQLEAVTLAHIRFNCTIDGAKGLVLNAQNLENCTAINLMFERQVAGVGHSQHIWQRNGGLNIFGMLSTDSGNGGPGDGTSSTDYAIISYDTLNIYGWRSEDKHLLFGAAVGGGGPSTLIGVWARMLDSGERVIDWGRITDTGAGAGGGQLAIINSSFKSEAGATAVMLVGSSLSPNVKHITLIGVTGLVVSHSGPQINRSLEHDLNNGRLLLTGADPYVELQMSNATALWKLGRNTRGTVNIAGAATSAAVTLSPAEADATYRVVAVAVASNGGPAAGATRVYITAKVAGGFTINVEVAPGGAASVDIDWHLIV